MEKETNMKYLILSLITGLISGGVFSLLKLPIPAPSTLPGLFGIIGLFLGYMIVQRFYYS
jgi:XapX domain-containing protein